jgi:predicted nucleic acid-binding protein
MSAVRLQRELARKRRRFLTTDCLVDETVTLLIMRHSHSAATDFLDTIERSETVQLNGSVRSVSRGRRSVPEAQRQIVVIHRLRQLRYHARTAHS